MKFIASTKCMKNWHLGNYLSSFPQEILLDWDGPNGMGSFSALWQGACLSSAKDRQSHQRESPMWTWIEKEWWAVCCDWKIEVMMPTSHIHLKIVIIISWWEENQKRSMRLTKGEKRWLIREAGKRSNGMSLLTFDWSL